MLPFQRGSLLLAPMVGITNRAFRTLIAEIGAPDYFFTEMASAEAFCARAQYEEVYTDPLPDPARTSVQFYARSPESMAQACRRIQERPEQACPAGIDINLACSAPHIRRQGGGSAWSSDAGLAFELVAAARSSWPRCLSAKIRTGPDDNYDRLLRYAAALASGGLDFLTLHPRTDSQKFKGSPNWDLVGRLSHDLAIPVIGNGDIKDVSSLWAVRTAHNPYAVMIGRQAVREPWIFNALRLHEMTALPGSHETRVSFDRLEIAFRFIDLVQELLPEKWKLETLRRFFSYYTEGFSFAHHANVLLANSDHPLRSKEILSTYFEQVPQDRYAVLE
ncbi:MAG: tRNA-dihydrouridine synthase family protein [Spirochaetia bacterium]|nr:tRNA-dihydrouridine synthase family protein [Spirochaetia bacterium]